MNHQRRLPTRHEIDLSQKLLEIRKRRKSINLESHLHLLSAKWETKQNSASGFISNYLEDPQEWINEDPNENVKKKGITRGDMMCTRMQEYLEVIGYQPAEISEFFTLAGRVNKNYKMPQRKEGYSPSSLDCYEGRSERKWLLDKFQGELGNDI
ncbi:MAG: hypothetical protein AABW82_00015 [Nanoarchaeota archaeon]